MTNTFDHKEGGFFWQLLRIIFVFFSLYLLGDAFYRWDGFSYYASFSEFLPSVSLAFALWSIVSFFAALALWTALWILKKISGIFGLKIENDQLMLVTASVMILGALSWKVKKLLWPDMQTTLLVKSAVLISVLLMSAVLGWLLRKKAEKWDQAIQYRITPLVWLFGTFIIFSLSFVSYHTWLKKTAEPAPRVSESAAGSGEERPNIILVTFDALAAHNMSVYGYSRETTPFISQWAKDATLFTMAESSSNFTAPATASLMTGKRVWTHQTYHIEGTKPINSATESLPSLLKQHGYFNIALVVNPFASVKMLGISEAFHIAPPASEFSTSASLFGWKFGIVDKMLYSVFGEKIKFHNWIISNEFIFTKFINLISRNITTTEVPPDKVFERFLNLVRDNRQWPFFVWIHIFPPHDPYLPPEPFAKEFNPSSELRSYKLQEKLVEESYKYLFENRQFPEEMQPSVDLMRDHYDEFVKYIDKEYEGFIEAFNERQIENTVIILSADHGESFEHGYFTHGGPFLYEQVTHIPLIIKEPAQRKGSIVDSVVEQIDIAPTILDLANIPPPSWMEGRSIVPLMKGEQLPMWPAFSMNFQENRSRGHQITKGSIAAWEGDYKLIHYLESQKSLLFNLKNDPEELNDLIDREPGTGGRLLGLIQSQLQKANKKISLERIN